MSIFKFKSVVFLVIMYSLFLFSYSAFAEDIEIYKGASLEEKEKARVMLLFDTSGSMERSADGGATCYLYDDGDWDEIACVNKKNKDGTAYQCYNTTTGWGDCPASRMQVAKSAVKALIDSSYDNVDFGLARFKGYNSGSGYILSRIGSGKTKTQLKSVIDNLDTKDFTPLLDSGFELYSYFAGKNLFEASSISARDRLADNGSSYISPFSRLADSSLRCNNNAYLIYMTDGDPYGNPDSYDEIETLTGIANTSGKYEYLPALAKYMATKDVYTGTTENNHVFTYTIGFGNGLSSSAISMLKSMADSNHGKGKNVNAANAASLSSSLKAILNDIEERSGNFTSPSVAASQSDNTRTKEFVYYSLFSPSGFANWNGNIKKLKITGQSIVDQENEKAIDDNGNIVETAKTFWRDFTTKNNVTPDADGGKVAEGGLDDQFGAPDDRKIFTDIGDLLDTDTDVVSKMKNVLKSHYGVEPKADEAEAMIEWMRGVAGYDKDDKGIRREHIMGDALHSKPAAITYEGNEEDKTHLLFGTNAGFVHFFEDTSTTKATEVWSFIPSELFSIQPSLRDSDVGKVYGMDLTPTIYHDDSNGDGKVNSGETAWAFFGMRRGGSTYYALDISDRTNPKLLWSKGNADYPSLGQTWSQPKVIYVNHPSYTDKPLLVFGAGYDKKQFEEGAANTVGAGVYLVDAETGDKVWSTDDISFAGKDSIVSRIATLDSDYDGYTDRLYAADVSGKIWRIDLAGTNMADWSAFEFANLSANLFYQPEVARTYYSKVTSYSVDGEVVNATRMTVPFEAVVVGSGDRTSPLDTSSNDSLYMIRDTNVITKSYKTGAPSPIKALDLMDIDPNTFGSLVKSPDKFIEKESQLASYSGWKYSLTGAGEKALAKPAIIGGVAYFPTFIAGVEGSSSCSLTGGEGRLYAFHLHYGVNIYENTYTKTGDSIPPTPELVYSEDSDAKSQFLLIGIGAGENNSGIIKAKSINDSAVPELVCDENNNCEIKLTGGFVGFKTHRSYLYKETTNKVN
ncbi:pilus assembly protein [Pseudoalteromonas spongiae]|uniref:pilus assembly protein n=1 Tax=Pseudoalteromonas spongiae TaxID=298657 RepID=UPI003734D617